MADLILPADGETNWGGKLRTAINDVNDEVNGRLGAAGLSATIGGTVLARATTIGSDMTRPSVPRLTLGTPVATVTGTPQVSIVAPAFLDTAGFAGTFLARYYIFTSPDHAGSTTSGIHLWLANDLTSTWTYHSRVIDSTGNQIESPSVVYNPDTGVIHLYAQAYGALIGVGGQLNFVWTATPAQIAADPTAWVRNPTASHQISIGNHQADAVSEAHTGYQQVILFNSTYVSRGLVSGGAIGRNCTWYSSDGLKFWPDLMPNAGDIDLSPVGVRDHLQRFVQWQGQIWGLGSRRTNAGGGGGATGGALMGRVRDDLTGWAGRPTLLRSASGDVLPDATLFVTSEGRALFFSTDYTTIRYYEVSA